MSRCIRLNDEEHAFEITLLIKSTWDRIDIDSTGEREKDDKH